MPEGLPVVFSKSHRVRMLAADALEKRENLRKQVQEMANALRAAQALLETMEQMVDTRSKQILARNLSLNGTMDLVIQLANVTTGTTEVKFWFISDDYKKMTLRTRIMQTVG